MNEFLKLLNVTDGERLFWYGVFILIALGIIVDGIVKIFKISNKK